MAQTGDISEVMFIAWCMEKGLSVSIPFGDRLPYDVIVDINGRLVKVQVKTAWRRKESNDVLMIPTTTTTTRNGKWHYERYLNSIDVLVSYDPQTKKFYCFDQKILASVKRDFSLRTCKSHNNQIKGSHWAEDYELDSVEQLLGVNCGPEDKQGTIFHNKT